MLICIFNTPGVIYLNFIQTDELNRGAKESFLRLLYMFSLKISCFWVSKKVASLGLHFASRWWFTSNGCLQKGSFQKDRIIHHVEEPFLQSSASQVSINTHLWKLGLFGRLGELKVMTAYATSRRLLFLVTCLPAWFGKISIDCTK